MRHPRHSVSACPLVPCSGEVLRKERAEKGEIESSPTGPAAPLSSRFPLSFERSAVILRRVLILTARTARFFVLGPPRASSSSLVSYYRLFSTRTKGFPGVHVQPPIAGDGGARVCALWSFESFSARGSEQLMGLNWCSVCGLFGEMSFSLSSSDWFCELMCEK